MTKYRLIPTFMLGLLLFFLISLFPHIAYTQETTTIKITNEMIYQKLLELEKNQIKFEEKFNSIDKQFEQIDKRFEQMEKRFVEFREYVDKRFDQIDKRFEDINKRFEDINKRFEDINKRFEDINKRFENLIHLFGIIVGAFVAIVVAVIGFALWDRRTIINAAKIETIKEIEKEGKLIDLIASLRKLAQEDSKIREVLKTYHLL